MPEGQWSPEQRRLMEKLPPYVQKLFEIYGPDHKFTRREPEPVLPPQFTDGHEILARVRYRLRVDPYFYVELFGDRYRPRSD